MGLPIIIVLGMRGRKVFADGAVNSFNQRESVIVAVLNVPANTKDISAGT